MYGGCSGFRTASTLTNTWEQLASCLSIYVCRCCGCRVGAAEMFCMVCLRRSTYVASGAGGWWLWLESKNYPGRRSVVPYTSSAVVHPISVLYAERIPRSI